MKSYLERLFEHVAWADGRVLQCLRAAPEPGAVRLFAHLLAAEQVWLARLQERDSSSLAIWPEWSLADCEAAAAAGRHAYARLLGSLTERALVEVVTYRNSAGVSSSTAVLDVLTHVALHGSYHRGQIAARVRGAGAEPVNTDFITFVREAAPPLPPLA